MEPLHRFDEGNAVSLLEIFRGDQRSGLCSRTRSSASPAVVTARRWLQIGTAMRNWRV